MTSVMLSLSEHGYKIEVEIETYLAHSSIVHCWDAFDVQ